MLKKGLNNNIDLQELLADNTKYIFIFESDFVYFDYNKKLTDELDDAYENNDESRFKKVLNEYSEDKGLSYKIREIIVLHGPGGGWPVIQFYTAYPMTVKAAIDILTNEFFGDEDSTIEALFGFDIDEANILEVIK